MAACRQTGRMTLMENFDAEQPMEDLQEQTPKKDPKNPLYDCYSLLHDLVYILAAITIGSPFSKLSLRATMTSPCSRSPINRLLSSAT